jgi:hypothetical protein
MRSRVSKHEAYYRFAQQTGHAYHDVLRCIVWLEDASDRPPPLCWSMMTVPERETLVVVIGEELVRKLAELRKWPA